MTCDLAESRGPPGHEVSTRTEIARRLAAISGFIPAGEYDPARDYAIPLYFVPSHTLTTAAAEPMRITGPEDLYGGVVPAAFAATKMITHPLVDHDAHAPSGWSDEFPRRVAKTVLRGFSAFSREDALRAGTLLFDHGAVRVKPATGIAGKGQWVARDASALAAGLEAISDDEWANAGVVLEENIDQVVTHSVGRTMVGDLTAAYCGFQHLVVNNHGAEVYGGSELQVVRGDFDALLALDLSRDQRRAIRQARVYDDAATACFPGFFASRRNYDVAQGTDSHGKRRSGVLEQSWRLGGASGAEIGALEAFRADPWLASVRAVTREVYGELLPVPEGAAVYFRGVDPRVGALTKYTLIDSHAHAR